MLVLWPIYKIESEAGQLPGVMTMSALLEERGFRSEAVAADLECIKRRIGDEPSVVLAFSTVTVQSEYLIGLNRLVKSWRPDVFSVFGGPHATYFPEMIDQDGVDAVCVGEGDLPMLEMVDARAAGETPTHLKNWWIKVDGEVRRNPIRPLMEDLDTLPIPDHLGYWKGAGAPFHHAIVMTSRGCPHCCSYCYNHVYRKLYAGKGRAVRRRSVNHVMRELRVLKENGCRFIRFMDDLFIVSPGWVDEFAARYRDEIRLPFSCLVRADFVTEEIVAALKSAGCHRIMMGIEAGNDRLRNEVLKRRMKRKDLVEAARIVRQAKIRLVTANILGIPTGSFEDDWETLELNHACRPSYASPAILQAYPGTAIHEFAEGLGLIEDGYAEELGSAFSFSMASGIRWESPREKRRIENLQKLFPIAVWFPGLRRLVRRLVDLPPNGVFRLLYLASVYFGEYFVAVSPRVGLPMFIKKMRHRVSRSIPSYRLDSPKS